MSRFGMVVDLNRCVGCQTCTIACKVSNDTPPGVQWRKVLDVEYGSFPDVQRLFLVSGCQHCAQPSCVPVCPTGATRQRADGLVTMDYGRCIGCASCAVACPYQARVLVRGEATYYGGPPTPQEQATSHDERLGVANKCTFCVERIDQARRLRLVPGVHPEVTPACANACISQAIRFGDFDDPASEVSRLTRDGRFFQMHAELGNDPQIRYLYEVPASMPGREPAPGDMDDAVLSDIRNPLVGQRQAFWDYRAAMNFMMGGMASGLAVWTGAAALTGQIGDAAARTLYLVAAAAMAAGLFFVFLKIGRKRRFLYVLRRPQSSWMTRETYCVAAFYPAAAAAILVPHAAWHAIAAAAALGFLVSQARILYASKGIPSWRAPRMPWLLTASGLYEGLGALALVVAIVDPAGIDDTIAVLGIALSGLVALWWASYRATARAAGIGPLSRRELAAVSPALHAVGHLFPVAMFGAAIVRDSAVAAALAGTAAIAGGFMWKFVVIIRACHQQGFSLPKMPRRGSGARAAPQRKSIGRGIDVPA